MRMYKGHTSDKTTLHKSFKPHQTFMNNVVKTSNCIFKSGRSSLRYFECKRTIRESLKSEQRASSIENQQITSATYTVLIIRVRQNWRVIHAAKMFGCSGASAHSLVRWFEQTGISIDVQDRLDVRKQRQDKTVK